jgi:hypothetical protein
MSQQTTPVGGMAGISTEQSDRIHRWQTGTESGESIFRLNHARADLTCRDLTRKATSNREAAPRAPSCTGDEPRHPRHASCRPQHASCRLDHPSCSTELSFNRTGDGREGLAWSSPEATCPRQRLRPSQLERRQRQEPSRRCEEEALARCGPPGYGDRRATAPN